MQNPEFPRSPQKVVVRVPNWVGDAVISLGFLAALKEHLRPKKIYILAHKRVSPLFRGEGEVITFKNDSELFKKSLKLKREAIDYGFVLPLSFASGLSIFLTGAKRRIGYKREGRSIFLNHAVELPEGYKKTEHLEKSYIRLLRLVGYEGVVKFPKLKLTADEVYQANSILKKRGLVPERTVALCPFASFGPSKEWGLSRFKKLALELLKRDFSPLVVGAPWERARAKAICSISGVQCIVGELPLRVVAAILSVVKLTVSNDSGLAHITASVGGSVIVIFGSTNPLWTSPLGERVMILHVPPPCSPCFKNRCPLPVHLCMENISIDDVIRGISKLNPQKEKGKVVETIQPN